MTQARESVVSLRRRGRHFQSLNSALAIYQHLRTSYVSKCVSLFQAQDRRWLWKPDDPARRCLHHIACQRSSTRLEWDGITSFHSSSWYACPWLKVQGWLLLGQVWMALISAKADEGWWLLVVLLKFFKKLLTHYWPIDHHGIYQRGAANWSTEVMTNITHSLKHQFHLSSWQAGSLETWRQGARGGKLFL